MYLKEPYSYFRWHGDNGQTNLDFALVATVCWGLCINHAWEEKVFLKNFEDLKTAIKSWFTHLDDIYNWLREEMCDQAKVKDYLTVRRAFSSALVTKGILELNIDTSA